MDEINTEGKKSVHRKSDRLSLYRARDGGCGLTRDTREGFPIFPYQLV